MENPVSQPAAAGDGVTRASTVASVTRINLDLVRWGFRQKSPILQGDNDGLGRGLS